MLANIILSNKLLFTYCSVIRYYTISSCTYCYIIFPINKYIMIYTCDCVFVNARVIALELEFSSEK